MSRLRAVAFPINSLFIKFVHLKNNRMKNFLLSAILLAFGIFGQCQNRKAEDGFVSIFDGKSLDGWKGDSTYWRVEN